MWKYLSILLQSCRTVSCNSFRAPAVALPFLWEVCCGGGFRVGMARSGGSWTGVGCGLMGRRPESQCTMGRLGHVALHVRAHLNSVHHTRGVESNCTLSRPHRFGRFVWKVDGLGRLFQIWRAWGNPNGVWVVGIRGSHIASLAFGEVLISALVLKWRCTV